MGTRADFYIGQGKDAEWLGSIAWDGYPDGIAAAVLEAKDADQFKQAVADFAKTRRDFTAPADGWPWPWDDSNTTDYAYALLDGKVMSSCFGNPWTDPTVERGDDEEDADDERGEKPDFPDMSARKNVAWGNKSGVMVISA